MRYLALLAGIAALFGCADDTDDAGVTASTTALSFSTAVGSAPAADALVLWNVSSGSPDYLYLWGRFPVRDGSLHIDLHARPPADAMNNYGLGVGLVVLVPSSTELPEGKQMNDDGALTDALGAAEKHAIIYVDHDQANAAIDARAATASPDEIQKARKHWLFAFPQGYACGEGREAKAGETFDSYAPVDCKAFTLRLGNLKDFEFPNWT